VACSSITWSVSEIDAAADSLAKAIAQGEVQPLMWFGASDFLRPLRSMSTLAGAGEDDESATRGGE
jgi:hypothetical protein